jgi:polyhydroxybutyrate depolymerase
MRVVALIGLIAFLACGGGSDRPIGGDRPVNVYVPASYQEGTEAPFLLVLHGYGFSGEGMETELDLPAIAEQFGFLYAAPNGLVDAIGKRYWNATDACCDIFDMQKDDSGYLRSVIEEIQNAYSVDPRQIFVFGHSNGAFMSHRLACDHADLIAGIVAVAGATFQDASRCQPTAAVNVLEAHGTDDDIILYDGGATVADRYYPGAMATTERWAGLNGCALNSTEATPVDFMTNPAGAETQIIRYADDCAPGGHVEHWRMQGAGHVPQVNDNFIPAVIDYFYTHPKL